ncbi:MAG: YeeE/YedE family protein [Planctomycetes bacterium]|nr:YeeE/YedE family protein [Planctomycetota bacterium]
MGLSLLVGVAFGFVLECAGFGSSRRLAGIFYFRDMTVLKVMFSGLVTAMLGLAYLVAFGWISLESIYLMPTVYVAQIVGGLIFGVGFVMSGWCPGTAAVGLASGKLDALLCLCGAVVGSILFNELYPVMRPLQAESGVQFIYANLGMSPAAFALVLTVAAVIAFWGVEYLERRRKTGTDYFNSPSLKGFGTLLVVFAVGLFIVGGRSDVASDWSTPAAESGAPAPVAEQPGGDLLAQVEAGRDHVEPEELAERLSRGTSDLLVVDVRPAAEFSAFHIRGAVNIPLSDLETHLQPYKNRGQIVLYSNGMTHPAQARDYLANHGFGNIYILTDGLTGFVDRCLKPASLRAAPVLSEVATKINAWRAFFLGQSSSSGQVATQAHQFSDMQLPGLVTTDWLADDLTHPAVRIIDMRPQPEYNTSHIPGALRLDVENLRGSISGVGSMLLPARMIAEHLSQMGIEPYDLIVLVSADKVHDATLAGIALERVRHRLYAVLGGGWGKWVGEGRPRDTALPIVIPSSYYADELADHFTVDYTAVLQHLQDHSALIIDVRPAEYYTGAKSDEARAGHIPGALNRPFTEDLTGTDKYKAFKPIEELKQAYSQLIPSRDATVIVHCRTGHQASQTFFVLRQLLGYRNVLWYDAGWSEWAARPELPIQAGDAP